MLRMTLAAAVGALAVQAVEALRDRGAPSPELTSEQRDILAHMRMVYAGGGGGPGVPTIVFEGVNVQIANGTGSMETTNGRGNLIVGYQIAGPIPRGGSHNIVVGDDHAYTSYGGIVSGEANQLFGPNSVALAGESNTVRGEACVVVAGMLSDLDGSDNVVLAGDTITVGKGAERCTVASSWASTIQDGTGNLILGGQNHSVEGGSFNAVITGTGHHLLFSDYAGVIAGEGHELFGAAFAGLLGGQLNSVSPSYFSTLVGGSENSVSAEERGTV